MPTICIFFGIIIRMYYDDHNPPHFHVQYNDYDAIIEIESLSILKGNLPPRALGMVLEWAYEHKKNLLENWEMGKQHKPLKKIEPLE